MILSLCLNPAIDRSIHLEKLVPGQTNRALRQSDQPGGKGINCAGVLAALGQQVRVAAFMSRLDEAEIGPVLLARGCQMEVIEVGERTRVNLKLIDEGQSEVTEINAAGAAVGEEGLRLMSALTARLAQGCSWALLSGSLPPGCPPDYYASLMRNIRQSAPGCLIALDVPGDCFRYGLREVPDLVKPNLEELSFFLGTPVQNLEEAALGAETLRKAGAKRVIVSMGKSGALLTTAEGQAFAPAQKATVVTTVGAGDAMLSGFVAGQAEGLGDLDSFRLAVLAASAAVSGKRLTSRESLLQVALTVLGKQLPKV